MSHHSVYITFLSLTSLYITCITDTLFVLYYHVHHLYINWTSLGPSLYIVCVSLYINFFYITYCICRRMSFSVAIRHLSITVCHVTSRVHHCITFVCYSISIYVTCMALYVTCPVPTLYLYVTEHRFMALVSYYITYNLYHVRLPALYTEMFTTILHCRHHSIFPYNTCKSLLWRLSYSRSLVVSVHHINGRKVAPWNPWLRSIPAGTSSVQS